MDIYRIIYTKVDVKQSPWKKTNFHAVFYSLVKVTANDTSKIGLKIYLPTNYSDAYSKTTFFFEKLQDQTYLVVIDIKALPEERDGQGRKGIYLCQAFLFPAIIWTVCSSPSILKELVQDKVFQTRKELFQTSEIDTKTGDLQPIAITKAQLERIAKTYTLQSEFECNMALLLYKIAKMDSTNRIRILFRGDAKRIGELFERILFFVPNEYKDTLGLDPDYRGDFYHYQLKIVGYQAKKPSGGEPIEIDVDQQRFPSTPDVPVLLEATNSYEIWLSYLATRQQRESLDKLQLDSLLLFADLLEGKGRTYPTREIPHSFLVANEQKIRDYFLQQSREILEAELAKSFSEVVAVEHLVELFLQNFPKEAFAKHLESFILQQRFVPKDKNIQSEVFTASVNPVLTIIYNIWTQKGDRKEDLIYLLAEKRKDVWDYMVELDLTDGIAEALHEEQDVLQQIIAWNDSQKVRAGLCKLLVRKYRKSIEELAFLGFHEEEIQAAQPAMKKFQLAAKVFYKKASNTIAE
ncbi:MAG: hypothetical protein AAF518_15395 [Spirochaetota bacterium]